MIRRKKARRSCTSHPGSEYQVPVARYGVCRQLLWREGKSSFSSRKGQGQREFLRQWPASESYWRLRQLATKRLHFQQDGAPEHFSRLMQEWISQRNPDFIKKDEWPPNSPDLNPLDHCLRCDAGEIQGLHIQADQQSQRLNSKQWWMRSGKNCCRNLSTWRCWHSGRGCRQKEVTLNTCSTSDQHRKITLFRASINVERILIVSLWS